MKEKATVWADYKNNIIIILILLLGFSPFLWQQYLTYFLCLIIPFVFTRGFFKFGENSLLVLMFGLSYGFTYKMNCDIENYEFIASTLFPISVYQGGMYIYKRFQNLSSAVLLLVLISMTIGLWAIGMCIGDYLQTGNIVNVSRSIGIDEDVWEKDAEAQGITATGMGVLVSLLFGTVGIVMVQAETKMDKLIRLLVGIGAIFALYVTVHLLNRTGLVVAFVSFMIGFFRPPVSSKKIGLALILLLLLCGLLAAVFYSSELVQKAIEGYSERNDVVGYGVGSMGGRTDRWAAAIEQIASTPFGSAVLDFPGAAAYAHNMWLDCAIVGGWFPAVILLVMTFRFIGNLITVMKMKTISNFNRSYLLLFSFAVLIQSAVEPILQSNIVYFCSFILLWAIVDGLAHSTPKSE